MDSKKIALNAVCTAVVAGLANKYLLGDYDQVIYYGMPMNSSIAVGLGCGAGSIISDLTSDMVIKRLGVSNQVMNGSVLATKAGVGALSSAGVLYFGGAPAESMIRAMAIGAGSKLGGDYAYDKVFSPVNGFISI